MAAKKKLPAKKKSAPGKKSVSAAKKPFRRAAKPAAAAKKSSAGKSPAGKKTAAKSAGKKTSRPTLKSKRPAPRRQTASRTKTKAKVVRAPKSTLPAAPEALALANVIAGVALEKKGLDVLVLDTRARAASVGYDYVVLASGESDRQLTAIHEGVEELLKPQGKRSASVEASPDWVCVTYDVGVVAHFLTTDRRSLMNFEELWHDAPRVQA